MGWRTSADVAEFLAAAGDYLRAERVRNTVILTVTETIRAKPGRYGAGGSADPDEHPLFGWWTAGQDDGTGANPAGAAHRAVAGAFMHTPSFPVFLSGMPAAAAAELAAETLAGRRLDAVNGTPATATAFGAARRERAGGRAEVRKRMRLYRLEALVWPEPPCDGAGRPAREADAALLAGWFAAFAGEVDDGDAADAPTAVRDRLAYGGITVWEAGGAPVSIAGISRQVAGMVRVGPVYTPPGLRGRGYATAVTASVSRQAFRAGAEEVLLYTDLANPVSNSIYQRIGYRPVEDRLLLVFSGG